MEYFLAVDIGASSGRHILGYMDGNVLKTEEIYRFKNGGKLKNGHIVWDMDELFKEVLNGLRRAKDIGKVPSYIGIDTWAVDYVVLDADGGRIGDVFSYRDSRTDSAVEGVHRHISFNELYKKTGIQFQPFNTLYQLYSDKLTGKLKKADCILMLPDYLNFCLTGIKKQEYTNATSTGIINAVTHDWDGDIIEILGLNGKLFNSLSQPGTLVGGFTEEVRRVTGYDAKVILPATHDTASAVLAAPLDGESPYISSGTWSLLGIEQDFAHTDDGSMNANYSNEGSINFKFRYQKNIMGLWLIQSVKNQLGGKFSFATLSAMARCKNDAGLIDVNDSRFLSPKNMMEEINRATGKNLNIASALRVIYDSLAKSYAYALDELEKNTGKNYTTLNIIGGGSQDDFLNELTAKATGKKIITGPVEATAIGNLAMQMIGAGELSSVAAARKIIKNSFEVKDI